MYKVALYTLGCKVSLYESEAIGEAFAARGFEVVSPDQKADIYVINTCTVTAESDAKSRKYIRRAIRSNPRAGVFVIGCYSQRSPDEVAAIEGVAGVLGTRDKLSVVPLAEKFLAERESVSRCGPCTAEISVAVSRPEALPSPAASVCSAEGKEPLQSDGKAVNGSFAKPSPTVSVYPLEGAEFEQMRVESAERTRGYVKIEDGCECRCTYCAIADARGPVRSKLPERVIEEVEGLYKNGSLEVVLTGIETGSYGKDLTGVLGRKYTLADLLTELNERKSCHRIRLGSMAPELVGEEFVERISALPIMTPHIHLSIQSGSSSVLRAMKRRYNREMLLECIDRLKEKIPRIMITADLLVGFPGESEEDFLDTFNLVSRAELLDAHVFAYSKRRGTPAATMECQVPEEIKQERSRRLIAEKNRVREQVLSEVVTQGAPLSVILESFSDGGYTCHSDSFIECRVTGPDGLSGKLATIAPLRHENGIIYGEIINIDNK